MRPVGGMADAIDLKSIGATHEGSNPSPGTTVDSNSCRAVCKNCTKGFSYPKRRGRPPGTCPTCAEQFSEVREARLAKREKRQIQQAQKESGFTEEDTVRFNRELALTSKRNYEASVERIKDIFPLPPWEEINPRYADLLR